MTRHLRAPLATPRNASEIENMARELRSAFSDMQQRLDTRLKAVEARAGGASIESVRAELRPHALAVADLQEALMRANRVTNPRELNLERDRRANDALRHWAATRDPSRLQEMDAWRPLMQTRATVGSTTSGPLGGYVCIESFSRNLARVASVHSPFLDYVHSVTIGTLEYVQPIESAPLEAVWEDEPNGLLDTDSPDYGQLRIVAHTLRAEPKMSRTLFMDSAYDLLGELAISFGRAFEGKAGSAMISGNGIGKPRGFTQAPVEVQSGSEEPEFGTIGAVATGNVSGWSASPGDEWETIKKLPPLLNREYLPNAHWFCSRETFGDILLFKTAAGEPVIDPSIRAGVAPTMFAHPVALFDEIDSDTAPLYFGDMRSAYLSVLREGVEILLNPFRQLGWIYVTAWSRRGGGLLRSQALKAVLFQV